MAHWTIKVKTVTEDPENDKLITTKESFLVRADTIEDSQDKVREYFRESIADYEIISIAKSNIVGYIDINGNTTD